ncbi:hypothetical protein LTR94_029393, partial [Friedmanniomyces endolithicus]
QNPQLIAARRNADAARYDISVARANRLPRIAAVSSGNYFNYLGSINVPAGAGNVPTSGVNATVGAQLTMPLFQGGRPAAQVRQAEALRGQALENTTATERQVVAQVRSAYAVWQSSQEVIASAESAVRANSLSLEGVRAENSVGTRTVLDILNAEQELLNSQVTLVTARRDAYVAGFALLAAMGVVDAEALSDYVTVGELSLDGRIAGSPGVLLAAMLASGEGRSLICPAVQGAEAAWAGTSVVAAPDLLSLLNHLKGEQ